MLTNRYHTALLWVTILYLLTCIHSLAQESVRLTGVITDSAGTPIPNVNIVAKGTFKGTATDSAGQYSLALTQGEYLIRFQHIGYKTVEVPVEINAVVPRRLDVVLIPSEIELGTVTVRAKASSDVPWIYSIHRSTARNVPPLGEPDPLRGLVLLPGITQPNDLKTSLSIRGGAADQNQYLLDGVEIYNPEHLFGLFSAFNHWVIETIEIHPGHPPQYGDRLSGVIKLTTRSVPDTGIAAANLSLISSSFLYGYGWNNTSLLVAGRRTYLDLITALVGQKTPYHFYDLNLKLTHQLHPLLTLDFLAFTSVDAMTGSKPDEVAGSVSAGSMFSWGNRMVSLSLRHTAENSYHTLRGSYSQNYTDLSIEKEVSSIRNRIEDIAISYQASITLPSHRLDFGGSLKRLNIRNHWNVTDDYNLENVFYEGIPPNLHSLAHRNLLNIYVVDEFFISPVLSLQGGTRYARVQNETGIFNPYLMIQWYLHPSTKVSAAVGRSYQFVAEGKEGIEGTIGEPLFLLESPMKAWTFSVGGIREFSSWYQLSIDAYYRRFNRLAALSDGPHSETIFPNFIRGDGRAYGLNCWLDKSGGQLTFQLAYSFLSSRVQFNGVSFPPAWDVRHSFKGLIGFRLGATWLFTAAIVYRSGAPLTPVVGKFFGPGGKGNTAAEWAAYANLWEHFIEGEKHSARLPAYLRLDAALRKEYRWSTSKLTLYIQVLNLLFRKNPLRYSWEEYYHQSYYTIIGSDIEQGVSPSLPIIPSVGVEIEF